MKVRCPHRFCVFLLLGITFSAWASTDYVDFLNALAKRESGLNQKAVNSQTHYIGLFQFGEAALVDLGVYKGDSTKKNDWIGGWTGKYGATSEQAFLNSTDSQLAAISAYENRVWNTYLKSNGSTAYVGQTINGILITESGLIAAAHLVGPGAVAAWLKSGGTTTPSDAMGTLMTEYLTKFGGYNMGNFQTPTYAQLLAANPTGGVGSGSTTTSSSTGSGSTQTGSTGSIYANASDGFAGGSGISMGSLRTLLVAVLVSVSLLMMGQFLMRAWEGYSGGKINISQLQLNVVRGIVILMVVITLVQ